MRVSLSTLGAFYLLWYITIVFGYPDIFRIQNGADDDIWSNLEPRGYPLTKHLNTSNHESQGISQFFSPLERTNVTLVRSKRATMRQLAPKSSFSSKALSRTTSSGIAKPVEPSKPARSTARMQSRTPARASRPAITPDSSGIRSKASLSSTRGANSAVRKTKGKMPRVGSSNNNRHRAGARASPTSRRPGGSVRNGNGVTRRPSIVGRKSGGLLYASRRRMATGRLPSRSNPTRRKPVLRAQKQRLQRRTPRTLPKSRAPNRRAPSTKATPVRPNRKTQTKIPVGRKPIRVRTPSRQRGSSTRTAKPKKLVNIKPRRSAFPRIGSRRSPRSTVLQKMRNRSTNRKMPVSAKKNPKKRATPTKATRLGAGASTGPVKNHRKVPVASPKGLGRRLASALKSRIGTRPKPKGPSSLRKNRPSVSGLKSRIKNGFKSWGNKFKKSPKDSGGRVGGKQKSTAASRTGLGSKLPKGSKLGSKNNNARSSHVPKSVSAQAGLTNKGALQGPKNSFQKPIMGLCKRR